MLLDCYVFGTVMNVRLLDKEDDESPSTTEITTNSIVYPILYVNGLYPCSIEEGVEIMAKMVDGVVVELLEISDEGSSKKIYPR